MLHQSLFFRQYSLNSLQSKKRNAAAVTNSHSGRMPFKNPPTCTKGSGHAPAKATEKRKASRTFPSCFQENSKGGGTVLCRLFQKPEQTQNPAKSFGRCGRFTAKCPFSAERTSIKTSAPFGTQRHLNGFLPPHPFFSKSKQFSEAHRKNHDKIGKELIR